jgi:hypothetical protein
MNIFLLALDNPKEGTVEDLKCFLRFNSLHKT